MLKSSDSSMFVLTELEEILCMPYLIEMISFIHLSCFSVCG